MRYFLDTEFIEDGKTIDLISIAIVAEDGRELYMVNEDCDPTKADDWVLENVLVPMGWSPSLKKWLEPEALSQSQKRHFLYRYPRQQIKQSILQFIPPSTKGVEFWADYAAYDWVVFCQLFGKMIDLPDHFPMFCHDLQQALKEFSAGGFRIPDNPNEHDALFDARWLRDTFNLLKMEHDRSAGEVYQFLKRSNRF